MSNSSVSRWENTWSIRVQLVVGVGPLPSFDISAPIISSWCMACTIFVDTSWSVLDDVFLFTVFIGDVFMNLGVLQRLN
jgi:hypothetical protein